MTDHFSFFQRMLTHPVFGRDPNLFNFLDLANPPTRTKIKRGFFSGVKETLDARKTMGLKDPDDFFQKEREWAAAYGSQLKDARDKFKNMVRSLISFKLLIFKTLTLIY